MEVVTLKLLNKFTFIMLMYKIDIKLKFPMLLILYNLAFLIKSHY